MTELVKMQEALENLAMNASEPSPDGIIGLYIHIPFCKAKCHYCDFNSAAGRTHLVAPYIEALKAEMEYYSKRLKQCRIGTAFIGGGTPSYIEEKYIAALMDTGRKYLNIPEGIEVTIEANPGTLTAERLLLYRECGINRLSMGLQAWQEKHLKKLGRIHTVQQFVDNFRLAREVGFENINVDLIFGLPGQTAEEWEETLTQVLRLGPEHISCYSLKIEEGTAFGDMLDRGELQYAEDELDRRMYHHAVERLISEGFQHYEISNFAKPGLECRHNLVYWKTGSYLGTGAGAHSYLWGQRFHNTYLIEDYTCKMSAGDNTVEEIIKLWEDEQRAEYMMLGFRLTEGICPQEFRERFGKDLGDEFGLRIEKLVKKGLLRYEGKRIKLTSLGLDLANQVFMEFV